MKLNKKILTIVVGLISLISFIVYQGISFFSDYGYYENTDTRSSAELWG